MTADPGDEAGLSPNKPLQRTWQRCADIDRGRIATSQAFRTAVQSRATPPSADPLDGAVSLGACMGEMFFGGCFCGTVRFEISEIFDAGYCHCSICRRFSGSPFVLWANAPGRSFRLIAGTPAGFASSDHWVRYFCRDCGAPVYGRHPSPPEDGSDLVCILTPSLDTPDAIRPTAHIWCGSGLPYVAIRDDLPRFEDGQLNHPSKRSSWRAV